LIFRKRRPPQAPAVFSHAIENGDVLLRCSTTDSGAPVADWPELAPSGAVAVGQALAAAEDERTGPDGRPLVRVGTDTVRLHPAWVAGLHEPAAASLGLPPTSPMALDLKPVGRIDQADFRIATRWVRPGGQPIKAKVEGAFLTTSEGRRRIPEPLWSLHAAAMALAEPMGQAERFQALATLRAHWPEDARAPLEADAYLSELRVHYASSLSLKLGRTGPFDFDPVLFSAAAIAQADADGRSPDEELDNVLAPAAQRLFAEQRFRKETGARPVYVLRDGEYVFIAPELRPALEEVRLLQQAPEAERREFVLNPRRVLRARLGQETAERIGLDSLFVETEQFSARVAGVDVWRKPVLPWLAPVAKNAWVPERFGLKVGDDYFVVPMANVPTLLERLEAAAADGATTVGVGGLLEPIEAGGATLAELPVNDQVLEAVRGLAELSPRGPHVEDDRGGTDEADGRQRMFLVVRENFEEVEYAPWEPDGPRAETTREITPPASVHAQLKPHQVEGLTWLGHSVLSGRPGALLADDMGLGKTVQAIAFMAWLRAEAAAGRRAAAPFLIVAPTGLLGTWRDEIGKHLAPPRLGPLTAAFGPELRNLREEDSFSDRDIDTGRAALRSEAWRDSGVVLTTYETLRDYHFSFAKARFGLIIFDEVQKLKNPASQLTRAARTLNADFTLAMTGTPVENRLQDLWSIMDVVSPGLLGSSRDFEKRHPSDEPVALGQLKAMLTEPSEGRPPHMLRRMKSEALPGMPAKHVHPFEVEMPELQARAYRDLVVRAAAGAGGGTMGKGGMLSILAGMRGVSLHPVDPRLEVDDLNAYARDSARLSRTLTVLEDIAAKGEKALIFVEDLAMQERLAGLIRSRFSLRHPPMRINGGVPGPRRQALVRRFQEAPPGFDVMILSPKAGGVGLTLTAANHVIHLSRWWNPAVEDQATDRVFRIGQTREVHVHLPLAVHPDPLIRETSFDLRLDALIARKRQLTRDLFLPPENDDADLADLFREVSTAGPVNGPPPPPEAMARDDDAITADPPGSAPAAATATALGARIWRVRAGAPRPTEEIVALFAGARIDHVWIRDPYALVRRSNRQAQVMLLARLQAVAASVQAVTVEYAELPGDGDDPLQRREFGAAYVAGLPSATPRLNLVRRRERDADDDFHDRFIDLDVVGVDGAVRQHSLNIGRGAEALFDDRWQCTVTYAPPGVI
jgi:hypothetical protein